jgi:hypothetical protein
MTALTWAGGDGPIAKDYGYTQGNAKITDCDYAATLGSQ